MTLDEAIKHCEEKAEIQKDKAERYEYKGLTVAGRECLECANEHEQLAKWLEDYKRLLGERPQGKWILCEDTYFSKCSICGDIWLNEECGNYCPNCGQPMKKGSAK